MNGIEKIKKRFVAEFKENPFMVKSPGRINLIGEHTDYNKGFVLPAAIDKEIILCFSAREDDTCRIFSVDKSEKCEFNLQTFQKSELGWSNYILGIVQQLQFHKYKLRGFNCVFGGNIPIGSGLSSSAALECGIIYGLNSIFHLNIPLLKMVQICQNAENNFVGVQSGIMDQFSNMFGKKDSVIKLDCRSLHFDYYSFNTNTLKIILLDTRVKHALASSEYNVRRQQCEKGVEILQRHKYSIKSLRDATLNDLKKYAGEFEPVIYKRCEYVIEENMRVVNACEYLKNNDMINFGKQMFASHEGLRTKYEVSIQELDILVDLAAKFPAVLGARMMGGGFGGCTINLVPQQSAKEFAEYAQTEYKKIKGAQLPVYSVNIVDGTSVIN